MATQIALLAALQEVDQRLQRKERDLHELRQQVNAMVEEVAHREREAEERRRRIDELEARHRALEKQLKEEEAKIKEKRVRLNRVRNERELLALRREIDLMKEANSKLEDEVLVLLEQLEREKPLLAEVCAQLEALKDKVGHETSRLEMDVAALEQEVQRDRAEREEIVRSLDTDLCARYERIFARRGGVAVVQIRDGTCQGCHMRLPPHLCNQIQSSYLQNHGTIFQCPHCGRIVYWHPAQGSDADA
ncbi:MAG: C4-type zinc ribbon domain-containing protein [Candidatus Binatia bacterium]|nr:C4-type zinc ribbon domain-containing protein [Candidatus Binatia bacterium]